jgi:hypothetical protein
MFCLFIGSAAIPLLLLNQYPELINDFRPSLADDDS